MKLTNLCGTLLFALAAVIGTATFAQQDSVTRDVKTGDWVYTLHNPDDINQQIVWRYTPRNQIAPKVKSSVSESDKSFVYRYRVSNGSTAKHAIAFIWVRAPIAVVIGPEPVQSGGISESQYMVMYYQYLKDKRVFRNKTLLSAAKWYSDWNIKNSDFTEFGWFPTGKDDSYLGVPVGKAVNGFGITRPELPGVMFAEMKGATKDRVMMGGLPETGPVAEAFKTMEAEDSLWTPIMVPAIAIPQPYNGAELARRIKAHMNYWLKLELITSDALSRLNPQFDALIAAQEYKSKPRTKAAMKDILQEIAWQSPGLDESKNEEDDDEHDSEPKTRNSTASKIPPLNRLAARALRYDLNYLLKQ